LRSNFKSGIMRSMLARCFIAAGIAALIYAFVAAFAYYIARMFTWQPSPLYFLLNWVENNMLSVVVCMWFATVSVIIYHYWRKTVGYMEEIVEASKALTLPDDVAIHLPPVLRDVEGRMNQIKQLALLNERAARDEAQRKSDLIVYLAHDIKTPLTSVIGYLSLLDEAPDMPPEQRAKYTGITLEKAYRLDQLVDEFFEITRFNLQHITVSGEQINLSLMLRQLADEFYPMMEPQHKTAIVNAPEDLKLWGDADKLSRVFNNILKNAIAYSYDNCAILISAYGEGESTVISFTNEGAPIPREKLDMIFEKFFRLDSARSTNTGGAGLGLAIAKEIITAHGGTISAQSEGGRTVFTVVLPNGGPKN
jgi:two-component system sensor histidine kinase VanS